MQVTGGAYELVLISVKVVGVRRSIPTMAIALSEASGETSGVQKLKVVLLLY